VVERALTGEPRWRHDAHFGRGKLALAPDAVIAVTRDESGAPGEVLVAMEREQGRIVWMQELGGRGPGIVPTYRLAVADDVVYVGTAGTKISVTAYELRSGETIFERSFALPVDVVPADDQAAGQAAAFDMVPLDEKIVLVVGSEGETVVALLDP